MKNKRGNLIWGIALILFGGVYLLVNIDVIPDFSPTVWGVVFSGVSLVSLARMGLVIPHLCACRFGHRDIPGRIGSRRFMDWRAVYGLNGTAFLAGVCDRAEELVGLDTGLGVYGVNGRCPPQ